ncbi:MAG: hypothetical protein HYX40_04030 [Sphingobacteriales bacterium]|nr:hypothetical protein [Sphingobacteriales bacterium]
MPEKQITRDTTINYFKALLILGMVFSHSLQVLSAKTGCAFYFCTYINLITLPGFLFSFGYIYQYIYAGEKINFRFGFNKSKNILFGFYFSAITWKVIAAHSFSLYSLPGILLLLSIPPYSEFLVTLFLAGAVFFVFKKQLTAIVNSSLKTFIAILLLLLLSLLPFFIGSPAYHFNILEKQVTTNFYFGIFFGSGGRYYPLISYFIYFIMGMWFQKNKIVFSRKLIAMAIGGTLVFFIYLWWFAKLPDRFPPSIPWLLGPLSFIYLYYLLSGKIKNKFICSVLNPIGDNTLVYLLMSNLFIFSATNTGTWSNASAIGFALFSILFTAYIIFISRKYSADKI